MMTTTFTVNAGTEMPASFKYISAESLPPVKNGLVVDRDWYGETVYWELPAGTQYMVEGHYSRSQLIKEIGKAAMVRGVRRS